MTTSKEWQDKIHSLATKAQEVVSDDDLTQSQKAVKLEKIESDIHAAQSELSLHDQVKKLNAGQFDTSGAASGTNDQVTKSLGEQFTDSPEFTGINAKGRFSTGAVELKVAATINEGGLGAALATPTYLPGIVDMRFQPLKVADLFPQGAIAGNMLSYAKESAFTDGTAGVAEGAAKPYSDDTFVRLTEQLGKIATLAKLTNEILEDVPAVQSFLNARLVNAVQRNEQNALLNGTGLPTINGILNRTGLAPTVVEAAAPAVDTAPDALYRQITAIRTVSWLEPDGIVMNPIDWQGMRLDKDGNGQYYGGGPFTGAYGNGTLSDPYSIWGLRVVVTPAIAQKTALVGAFAQGGQIFRRGGITVDMTNSNVNDFENNLVTMRVEERALLAIFRPNAFGPVTLV